MQGRSRGVGDLFENALGSVLDIDGTGATHWTSNLLAVCGATMAEG